MKLFTVRSRRNSYDQNPHLVTEAASESDVREYARLNRELGWQKYVIGNRGLRRG